MNTTTAPFPETIITGEGIERLAKMHGRDAEKLGRSLLGYFKRVLGMSDDDLTDWWGTNLGQFLRDVKPEVINDALWMQSISRPQDRDVQALLSAMVMGRGKCPVCGGDVYLYQSLYHEEDGERCYPRVTPPDDVFDGALWRCEHCDTYFLTDDETEFTGGLEDIEEHPDHWLDGYDPEDRDDEL
jgi:hypothetical protein